MIDDPSYFRSHQYTKSGKIRNHATKIPLLLIAYTFHDIHIHLYESYYQLTFSPSALGPVSKDIFVVDV